MSENVSKPLYKKKLFWAILVGIIVVFYFIGTMTEDEQVDDDKQEEAVDENPVEMEEAEEGTEDESEKEETEQDNIIEFDERFAFGEFTVESIVTEINDDELTFKFSWINQSGTDKAPFTALGYIDVSQGDEILEEISGAYDPSNKSSILGRNHNGGILPVTMVYEIINDEPIKILFGATNEYDDSKEELIIDID